MDQAAIVGRQNLRAFLEELGALDRAGEIAWAPERLLVATARRAVGDGEEAILVPWPLAVDPSQLVEPADPASGWERCGILGPADTAILWPVLLEAETRTRFVAGGVDWWVDARPVLPDEHPACPGGQ